MDDDSPPILLYPFKLRDSLTGKRYRARWVATAEEIANLGGVIDGEPEIRQSGGGPSGYFQPYRDAVRARTPVANADMQPELDDGERFIVRAFLRRLSTYYVRRGRFAQAGGAARLWQQLR